MIPLIRIKSLRNISPKAVKLFFDKHGHKKVYIYSGQWGAYWRSGKAGYSYKKTDAGIYSFLDAFNATSHCDSNKQIYYEFIK